MDGWLAALATDVLRPVEALLLAKFDATLVRAASPDRNTYLQGQTFLEPCGFQAQKYAITHASL